MSDADRIKLGSELKDYTSGTHDSDRIKFAISELKDYTSKTYGSEVGEDEIALVIESLIKEKRNADIRRKFESFGAQYLLAYINERRESKNDSRMFERPISSRNEVIAEPVINEPTRKLGQSKTNKRQSN